MTCMTTLTLLNSVAYGGKIRVHLSKVLHFGRGYII